MEHGTGNTEVPNRTTQTLLPIIQTYILPGTTVLSDEWRAYRRITSIGMIHKTVNHSVNFVDPSSGTNTQSIESTLAQVKRLMEKKGVMRTSEVLCPIFYYLLFII